MYVIVVGSLTSGIIGVVGTFNTELEAINCCHKYYPNLSCNILELKSAPKSNGS